VLLVRIVQHLPRLLGLVVVQVVLDDQLELLDVEERAGEKGLRSCGTKFPQK
jgi:hypothetical protein